MSEYEIELYKIIGEMIRERRLSLGITLDQIAEKVGVTPKTIQRYETGERKIKINILIELSSILDFKYERFMADAKSKLSGESTTNTYYLNPETAKLAQELYESKEKRILLDATRGVSPEDILQVAELVRKLKDRDGND